MIMVVPTLEVLLWTPWFQTFLLRNFRKSIKRVLTRGHRSDFLHNPKKSRRFYPRISKLRFLFKESWMESTFLLLSPENNFKLWLKKPLNN
jgi:hypothetical protein